MDLLLILPGGNDMAAEQRDKYKALGLSVLLHLIIFAAAALSGLFVLLKPQYAEQNIQVVVYDEDSPGEGSAGGGSEPAVPPVPTADAIVIPDKTVLPEIHEEYTKEPERQQNYREVHEGNVFGRGGAGNGTGVGTGNKNGPGDGNAAGGSQASAAKPAAPAPVVPASVPAPPPPPPAPKQRVQATCIGTAMPVYPADLQEEGVEGAVTVKIYVDTDGSVERVEVTGSSGYGELDNAAAAAAARFRFSASDSKGYWTKTFVFRLTGE